MDEKLEYLKMIESIVERMAHNSFLLKGWAITVVSGLAGLSVWNDAQMVLYYLVYVPILMFWALDAFYLRQERLYRGLYEKIRMMTSEEINRQNYCLTASNKTLSSDTIKKASYFKAFFSVTEIALYFSLAALLTAIIVIRYLQLI